MRMEKDFLGECPVPEEAYYGVHTTRAKKNFAVSRQIVHRALIKALGMVKLAAAQANLELGYLERDRGRAICQAAEEVIAGRWNEQFTLDAIQGGAGTSTNMNVNEVITNRALELLGYPKGRYDVIHPNDHVNLHQSTNDVYPTAIRVAAISLLKPLAESLARLREVLRMKESEFAGVIKIGRTQLQDAVPITLGQEFGAYAQAIVRDQGRLSKMEKRLCPVNLGGTAVGTGLNAPLKYIHLVNEKLQQITGLSLTRAENMIDGTQNMDVFVEVSGVLKSITVNLNKIANDLRLLSSGPRAGFGELSLPEQQAGSSIMPGKVNPVIPELINQVNLHIICNDLGITLAAAEGQLELNIFGPTIAHNLLDSLETLRNGIDIFVDRCLKGLQANPARCRELLEGSLGIATALVPYIGYELSSEIAKTARANRSTVREAVLARRLVDADQLDKILVPTIMIKPGIAGTKIN